MRSASLIKLRSIPGDVANEWEADKVDFLENPHDLEDKAFTTKEDWRWNNSLHFI